MTGIVTFAGTGRRIAGRAVGQPTPGAPEGRVAFTYSWDETSRSLTVTPTAFPSETTHYRLLFTAPGYLARLSALLPAVTSPVDAGDVYQYFPVEGVDPDLPQVRMQLIPVNDAGDGRPGPPVNVQAPPVSPPAIVQLTPPTLFAAKVGDSFVRGPGAYNVAPAAASRTMQISADGSAWTDLDEEPSTVPAEAVGQYLRDRYELTGPAGDTIYPVSNSIGPIEDVPDDPDLFQIEASDIEIIGSFYDCGGDHWFRPIITISERLEGRRVRATTTRPDLVPNDGPDIHWSGELAEIPGMPGFYTIYQNDPAGVSCVISPTRKDFWVFQEPNVASRQRIRLSQQPLESDPVLDGWSPISSDYPVAWFVPVPGATPPDPENLVYRGLLLRTDAQRGMTPNVPHLDPRGIYPVDGFQWYPGCGTWSADGMKFCAGQDAGQLIFSVDQGQTCYRPRAQGLPLLMTPSVCFDPADNNRLFITAGSSFQYQAKQSLSGIYVSTDNANSFTRVFATPGAPGRGQHVQTSFAVVPRTGGPGSTWYMACELTSSNSYVSGVLAKSTDNGNTWNQVLTLPFGTYGRIYGVTTHPTNANIVYIFCEQGLFRSTNGGNNFNRTWYTGLPNTVISSVWIDPDSPNHILAGVLNTNTNQQGLWESTNGTSFSRIRACRLLHFGVGAKDGAGNRTIYVQQFFPGGAVNPSTDTPQVRLRNGTWITRTTTPTSIGVNFLGGQPNIMPFDGMTYSNSTMRHGWMSPHPTDPDLCIYHAKTSFLYTEDGGMNFTLCMGGLGGVNWRGCHYDPFNRNRVAGSTHDVGVARSVTGLDTTYLIRFAGFKARADVVLNGRNAQGNPISTPSFTGRHCVILPDDPTLPAAWRGRIIGGAGPSGTGNGVLYYVNWGETTVRDWLGSDPTHQQSNAQGGGAGIRYSAGYILEDPRKVWCGVNRITITGTNTPWTTAGGRVIFGAANDGTDTIYGFRGGGTNILDRSTDFGASWTQFAVFEANIISAGIYAGICSMFDGRRMFVRPGSRTLAMVWDNNGTAQVTTWNLTSLFSGLSPLPADATINEINSDPLDPRWLYIGTGLMGNGRKVFRLKFNANFTDFTVEDVTLNGPANAHGMHIHTNPHSGDVQVSHNAMGQFVLPAPEDWQPRCGAFRFSGQPANGNTLTVNGQTVTFVTSGAAGLQVNIGGNLNATMTALASVLNGSGNAAISKCTYTVVGSRLDVTIDDPAVGVVENVPLSAAGTPNATVVFARQPWKRGYWRILPKLAQAA